MDRKNGKPKLILKDSMLLMTSQILKMEKRRKRDKRLNDLCTHTIIHHKKIVCDNDLIHI